MPETTETTRRETPTEKFHAHLDVCAQCREHPFGLCPRGATLFQLAVNNMGVPDVHP